VSRHLSVGRLQAETDRANADDSSQPGRLRSQSPRALVAASALSSKDPSPSSDGHPAIANARGVERLLRGIPQRATDLGAPRAAVTLVEYADLQCPYCRDWARHAFPALVRTYVRPGKLQIEFRGLRFLGSDSERALRAALAAGRQGRFWTVVDLLYLNQGAEGSGWVTDGLLRTMGSEVRGLDVERMLTERNDRGLEGSMQAAEQAAERDGVTGTPSFELGPTGGTMRPLELTSLDFESLRPEIDALLAS